MVNCIHIVNGDSTREILEQSGIKGRIVVWREVLCDGPVSAPVFSDAFWQERYDYFENELDVTRLEYFDKTIKELLKAEFLEGIEEVTLWYEYDLFCQVNLMALCAFLLEHYRKDVLYTMICVGREKGREGWQTLTDFKPSEYLELFEKRIKMSRASFDYGHECWKVYAQKDKAALQNFNFRKNKRFKYFNLAMKQELERFPNERGLNQIDRKVLELISEGNHSFGDLVKLLLIWQRNETFYGFGDLQYAFRIEKLQEFYTEANGVLQLNEKGFTAISE